MTVTMTYAMNNRPYDSSCQIVHIPRWWGWVHPNVNGTIKLVIPAVGPCRTISTPATRQFAGTYWLEFQSPSLSYHLDFPFPIDIASLIIAVPRNLIDIYA